MIPQMLAYLYGTCKNETTHDWAVLLCVSDGEALEGLMYLIQTIIKDGTHSFEWIPNPHSPPFGQMIRMNDRVILFLPEEHLPKVLSIKIDTFWHTPGVKADNVTKLCERVETPRDTCGGCGG